MAARKPSPPAPTTATSAWNRSMRCLAIVFLSTTMLSAPAKQGIDLDHRIGWAWYDYPVEPARSGRGAVSVCLEYTGPEITRGARHADSYPFSKMARGQCAPAEAARGQCACLAGRGFHCQCRGRPEFPD